MKAVFDTNILVDYLNGMEAAREELSQYSNRQISMITYMEVLVGANGLEQEERIQGFLGNFEIIELSKAIANESISLRRKLRLKLPDAIIYATARTSGCFLVSRNTKDMKPEWPDIRVPHQV